MANNGMRELKGFDCWASVMRAARNGERLYYQAPLDARPTELVPGKSSTCCYHVRPRTIRIWPPGSVGRGRQRTADPFSATSHHLSRFSRS